MNEVTTWESEIARIIVSELQVSNSDAQGILQANEFYLSQSWSRGLTANKTFEYLKEKNNWKN